MNNIIKKPIAFTDSILYDDYDDFPWHNKWESEQTRSLEIAQYIGQNSVITHWVSIDDLDMSLREVDDKSWGLKNFLSLIVWFFSHQLDGEPPTCFIKN